MRIPGFTAEASLDRPSDSYRFSQEYAGASDQGVVPQRIKLRTVRCNCDAATDICVCDNGRVLSLTLGDLN